MAHSRRRAGSGLEFWTEQLARAAKGMEAARAARNASLGALNFRQQFKGHLMLGLMKWRQRETPIDELDIAVRLLAAAPAILRDWEPSFDVEADLPIGRAALIAGLVSVQYDPTEVKRPRRPPDVTLDSILADTVPGRPLAREPQALIQELRDDRRTALAAESYETYFQILANQGDEASLSALVKKAEALFNKRAADPFFAGGDQTEGGGPDNELTVDYRLAFALKKARHRAASIHAWAW